MGLANRVLLKACVYKGTCGNCCKDYTGRRFDGNGNKGNRMKSMANSKAAGSCRSCWRTSADSAIADLIGPAGWASTGRCGGRQWRPFRSAPIAFFF